MSAIGKRERAFLSVKFGNRVNFERLERKLYSHDIGGMPSLVSPLVGDTTPEGIVQPESEEELAQVIKWAYENGIPVTPRAKASSGYGGVLPIKGGLVVDFFRLNKVVSLDSTANTATVEAGIVWEKLEHALEKQGMMLRLYPSSLPGSTVGGWFCQGGAGFGSYEAGWFRENVLAVRVVLPTGEVRDYSGEDLDLFSDAEGVTGFVSQLTIRTMPKEELRIMAVGCPNAHDLQAMIQRIIEYKLPIWSMTFINPRMAELKSRAPLKEHWGHPSEERVILPAAYVTTIAYRAKDHEVIAGNMEEILRPCEGEILSDRIAHHEWEHRFLLMVVKRLGPSLIPTEVVVPLESLGDVFDEIEHKIHKPIVKEGAVIREGRDGKPEVVILGFIPADQRRFSFNLVFPLSLSVIKIAQKHGGRPYSTGLYFKNRADEVYGAERVARMKKFKREEDPKGLLNPGKVFGSGLLNVAMSMALWMEPLIRPFGNQVITKVGERPQQDVRGIPADVAWYAYSCSQCGYCVEECDQFYGRGWESQSPRGKWYWLREYMEGREEWSQFMVDTFLACTTCELCNFRCSAALPIEPSWMKLRGKIINEDKGLTFPPFYMMQAASRKEGNIWAGYRRDRDAWFPEELREQHMGKKSKIVYFAGCTASFVEDDIGISSAHLLHDAGVEFTFLGKKENCCGTPMLAAGLWDTFELIMKRNIEAVKAAGADTVITSCPACDMMWRKVYPEWAARRGIEYGLTSRHYSEVVAEKLDSGEFTFPENGQEKQKVTWHDSCHMGRVSGVYEEPRRMIQAIPGVEFVEMTHHHDEAHCCGSVLTLIKDPEVAHDIGKTRLDEAVEVGAQKVLAACPCCQFQLRVSADKRDVPIEVVDLAHFAAEALGHEVPDPNDSVRAYWAVFEKMIPLMTPRGFADLMQTMWPELIGAMPYGMGPMMRAAGKVPGLLQLMKPMFPILFPRLLPMMLPKVMDTMLQRIAAQVPMPDHMSEQMPEMMPGIMDNLMPHMIDEVVPLVSQPLIDHLRGKKPAALEA
ncbi:MAG: FAD-binding and (Fe-S)-binding domain-containing protein [Candidatus Lernaella stagnicola]|nr:FAD-binding and (Fe-S)-binding domain-containing protein [Candidatus Lernaella stagnicola]